MNENHGNEGRRRVITARGTTVALWAMALGMACLTCKGKSSSDSSSGKKPRVCAKDDVSRAKTWLKSLCKYNAEAFDSPATHWWGLRLIPTQSVAIPVLPEGTLMVLTPRALVINGKVAPDWPKPNWRPVDLRRGQGPILNEIFKRLLPMQSKLGTAGQDALGTIIGRSLTAEKGTLPDKAALGAGDSPSGRTLLTMVIALEKLRGKLKTAIVAVEPETPAAHVLQLFHLIELAHYDAVALLASPGVYAVTPPQPLDPKFRLSLGALRAGAGADNAALVKRWRKLIRKEERVWIKAGCKTMKALRLRRRDAKDKALCGLLARELPAVMQACNCAVPNERLLTLWQAMMTLDQPLTITVLQLNPSHASPVVTTATTPWSKFGPKLLQPGKGLDAWLRLRGTAK